MLFLGRIFSNGNKKLVCITSTPAFLIWCSVVCPRGQGTIKDTSSPTMLCFWTSQSSLFVPVFAKGVSYISKQPFPKKLGSHFSGCRTSLSTFYCICVHVLCVIVFVSEFLCVWICVWIQVIWRSKAFHSFPVIKMGFTSRWFTLCRLHWPLVVVLDFALNCRCQASSPPLCNIYLNPRPFRYAPFQHLPPLLCKTEFSYSTVLFARGRKKE